jgi:hypothetical protein
MLAVVVVVLVETQAWAQVVQVVLAVVVEVEMVIQTQA